MSKYFAKIAIVFWLLLLGLFLNELYFYAFTSEMGLIPALKMLALSVQNKLTGFGIITPILFIVLYTIRPLLFFPASIMTLTSVFVFGPYGGFVVSYIGETCSACLTFYIGKYFGEELGITQKVSKTKVGHYLEGNAFLSVFILRIVPIFPFDVVNYASGIAKIPFKKYILATLLGVLPGIAAFIFLGDSLLHTEQLPLAITLSILLIVIGLIIKKNFEEENKL